MIDFLTVTKQFSPVLVFLPVWNQPFIPTQLLTLRRKLQADYESAAKKLKKGRPGALPLVSYGVYKPKTKETKEVPCVF